RARGAAAERHHRRPDPALARARGRPRPDRGPGPRPRRRRTRQRHEGGRRERRGRPARRPPREHRDHRNHRRCAMSRVRVALRGWAPVGGGWGRLRRGGRAKPAASHGVEFSLARVLVRDLARERDGVHRGLLTARVDSAIPADADVVVELLGGIEPARSLVREALDRGLPVVTANKALLARHGPELFATATARGVSLGFEGSVCGGVPIVRALRGGLAGIHVESLAGVLNGTCNFVLTRMEGDGVAFDAALRAAQAAGFAEADPSLDIDGWDAAQKLIVLAALAFDEWVPLADVQVRG